MNRNDKVSAYASGRLKTRKDDRCSKEKLDSDARLRGSIGAKRANEIIKAIDGLKMRGL